MFIIDKLNIDKYSKDRICSYLEKKNITKPSKIQEDISYYFGKNENIYAISQTGSGKTLAYLLYLINYLDESKDIKAIICAPTEELSSQIYNEAKNLFSNIENINTNVSLLLGSGNLNRQIELLKKRKTSHSCWNCW